MEVQEHVALAPYTTFGIGGPARFFIRVGTDAELLEAVRFARARRLRLFTLGGGSNLLVPDAGFAGVVMHVALTPKIERTETHDAALFDVSAGTDWDTLVRVLSEQGASGMECLAGIPGLAGGAPIQNIGAYGQEVAETIDRVTALDLETLTRVKFTHAECGFRYRKSRFNSADRNRYVITAVRFRLRPGAQPNLDYADLAPLRGTNPDPLAVYRFVRAIRDRKGMLIDSAHPHPDSRSAGSFFKNPVVAPGAVARVAAALGVAEASVPQWPLPGGQCKLPAAWLIEQAGFPKGFALGPVGISTRHTLALVNRSGSATCADLLALRDLIVTTLTERFGIALEQEPVLLA